MSFNNNPIKQWLFSIYNKDVCVKDFYCIFESINDKVEIKDEICIKIFVKLNIGITKTSLKKLLEAFFTDKMKDVFFEPVKTSDIKTIKSNDILTLKNDNQTTNNHPIKQYLFTISNYEEFDLKNFMTYFMDVEEMLFSIADNKIELYIKFLTGINFNHMKITITTKLQEYYNHIENEEIFLQKYNSVFFEAVKINDFRVVRIKAEDNELKTFIKDMEQSTDISLIKELQHRHSIKQW